MNIGEIFSIGVSIGTLIAFVISVLNSRFHAGIAEGKREAEARTMIENDKKLEDRVDVLEEKAREIDVLATKMDFVIDGIKEIKELVQNHVNAGQG